MSMETEERDEDQAIMHHETSHQVDMSALMERNNY